MKLHPLFYIALASLFSVISCKSDDNNGMTVSCTQDYEQSTLLNSYADNIIIPSYQVLQNDLLILQTGINDLINLPDVANLEALQERFSKAYKKFQHSSHFELGPAIDQDYRANLNNFPVNLDAIHANLAAGEFDFDTVDADQNFDKGFPALDYFLFGYDDFLTEFQSNETLQNYTLAIIEDMLRRTDLVLTGWSSFGTDFKANQGTDAGSSLSSIINTWNENYELAKRDKLGNPAGVNALGIIYPEGVEGYYSGTSLALLQASLQASRDIFEGKHIITGTNGEGLDDLLAYVDAQKEGESLKQLIANQFELTFERLNAINGTLAEAIEQDNATVQAAYAAYAQQVLLTKTDMPSILCIPITYVDNPSDTD